MLLCCTTACGSHSASFLSECFLWLILMVSSKTLCTKQVTKGPTSCLCLRRGKENGLCWLARGRSSGASVNTLLQLKFVAFITPLQVANDLVFCDPKVTFSLGSNRETGPGSNAGRVENVTVSEMQQLLSCT